MAQNQVSAAVKILTGQLAYLTSADKKFKTIDGLEFQRVWVQGYVANVSPDGNSFEVTDNTGPPLMVYRRASAGEHVPAPGEYVLAVGKLGLKRSAKKDDSNRSQEDDPDKGRASGKRRKEWQLAAQKVRPLSGASRRADLWQQEVRFLHHTVYPKLAPQG
ncbi:hypothetical protein PLESTM_001506600 [Pleodorina starrii]|nr:hypothetical protein PLESTM_001506600 [Pleodorina starrii]